MRTLLPLAVTFALALTAGTAHAELDLDRSTIEALCDVDEPLSGSGGTGTWYIDVVLDGWAEWAWVEMWDPASGYCEGYDAQSGNPCESSGVTRPGWEMENVEFGEEENGDLWDQWTLELDYDAVSWPPADDESMFACELDSMELYVCACDWQSGVCSCRDTDYERDEPNTDTDTDTDTDTQPEDGDGPGSHYEEGGIHCGCAQPSLQGLGPWPWLLGFGTLALAGRRRQR